MSSSNPGFSFKLTFINSFRIAVSDTGFVNLVCSFSKLMQNSYFCGVNISYMLFVNAELLIQIYFS